MSHKMLRPFIVKVFVFILSLSYGYFPLSTNYFILINMENLCSGRYTNTDTIMIYYNTFDNTLLLIIKTQNRPD